MNQRRSYYWVGVPYAIAGVAFTAWSVGRAEWSWAAMALVPLSMAALGLGQWSANVAPGLQWAMGTMLIPAILVLAPGSTAPAVGSMLGLASGFDHSESRDFRPGRLLVNAGALGLAWGASGVVLGVLRPASNGPSTRLVLAIAAAYLTHLVVNALLLAPAVAVVFGWRSAPTVPLSLVLLGPTVGIMSIAVALVASVTEVGGPAFLPIATVAGAVVVAIPVVGSNIRIMRRDIAASLTRAVDVELLRRPPEESERIAEVAREAGLYLGLSSEEVEQVRYLSSLFSVTDQYAQSMPRSFEQRFEGAAKRSSIWPLLAGLPVEDLGSQIVIDVAKAVSICCSPMSTGTGPVMRGQLDGELRQHEVPEVVRRALLGDLNLPAAYKRVLLLNPDSSLRLLVRHRGLRQI